MRHPGVIKVLDTVEVYGTDASHKPDHSAEPRLDRNVYLHSHRAGGTVKVACAAKESCSRDD